MERRKSKNRRALLLMGVVLLLLIVATVRYAAFGAAGRATAAAADHLLVHVVGAVDAPGLYRLAPHATVGDAVAAASPAADAAPERLQLERELTDRETVAVPFRYEQDLD